MVLEAGAEIDVVNSVGRTAAQMAAFVGKDKECLSIFHLFIRFIIYSSACLNI